jgi:hypothetical protein
MADDLLGCEADHTPVTVKNQGRAPSDDWFSNPDRKFFTVFV